MLFILCTFSLLILNIASGNFPFWLPNFFSFQLHPCIYPVFAIVFSLAIFLKLDYSPLGIVWVCSTKKQLKEKVTKLRTRKKQWVLSQMQAWKCILVHILFIESIFGTFSFRILSFNLKLYFINVLITKFFVNMR